MKLKVISIVGARPQFIKLAPLNKAVQSLMDSGQKNIFTHKIIHTGQHYDYLMDKIFFDQLGIPKPDYNLGVGSGSHAWQLGEMAKRLERIIIEEMPNLVMVYGDTNSTLAGSLVPSKLGVRVAHIESGLRSFNRNMPEEINRICTDHCSDILFFPTETAHRNLKKEGINYFLQEGRLLDIELLDLSKGDIFFPLAINVGDIMFDSVLMGLEVAKTNSTILKKLHLRSKSYFLVTVHREENTCDLSRLQSILDALVAINNEYPVVFPIHPRTKKTIEKVPSLLNKTCELQIIEPVSYFDMLILQKNALKVLTDSGGMQKEAFFLKVPCVTMRDETEWVETLSGGYNILAGADSHKIVEFALKPFKGFFDDSLTSIYGDGKSAERIIGSILMLSSFLLERNEL